MKRNVKQKLQLRFVLLSMTALLLLQGTIVFFSAYSNYRDMTKKADMILAQIRENPTSGVGYFSAAVHAGKSVIRIDRIQNLPVSQENAIRLAKSVLDSGSERGFFEGYRYQLYRDDGGAIRILFLSRAASIEMYRNATVNLIVFSLAGLAVMCILLSLASGLVVEPLVKNQKKQKEFITSASHELKTPLAVMLADVQLLETEVGDSPWIEDIQAQITRMTKMTESLVALSRAEEAKDSFVRTELSLSAMLRDVLRSYEAMVKSENKHLTYQIEDGISYEGDEPSLRQLISILLDNAFKYCPVNGEIEVSLRKKRNNICLSVTNSAENINREQLSSFSDRFFRGQNTDKIQGFGLGLSIAKTVVANHNGIFEISAPDDRCIRVTVTLR